MVIAWPQIDRLLECSSCFFEAKTMNEWIIFNITLRYTCLSGNNKNSNLQFWNTSVSDHCCLHCNGVVYKPNSIIATIQHHDKCQTVETSICRTLPGKKRIWMSLLSCYPLIINRLLLQIKEKELLKLRSNTKNAAMMLQVLCLLWIFLKLN